LVQWIAVISFLSIQPRIALQNPGSYIPNSCVSSIRHQI